MTGQQDKSSDVSRILFLLAQILAVVKQTHTLAMLQHTQTSANSTAPASGGIWSRFFSKELLIQYLQHLPKVLQMFGPMLQPYVLFLLGSIATGIAAVWKWVLPMAKNWWAGLWCC